MSEISAATSSASRVATALRPSARALSLRRASAHVRRGFRLGYPSLTGHAIRRYATSWECHSPAAEQAPRRAHMRRFDLPPTLSQLQDFFLSKHKPSVVGPLASLAAASSAVGDSAKPVERALQDVGGRHLVDHLRAPGARDVVCDQRPQDDRGGKPLVPEDDRQSVRRREIAGEGARRLGARAVAPLQVERQPDTISATISNSANSASSASASFWNAVRASVFSGEASRRSTSDSASPIVLVPRSTPIRRALAGRRRASSSRAIGRFIAGRR